MYQLNPLLEMKSSSIKFLRKARRAAKSGRGAMKEISKTDPVNIKDVLTKSGRKFHWKEASKAGNIISARQATPEEVAKAGGLFRNKLANGTVEVGGKGMPFKAGDWIAKGKRGEEWIPSKFAKNYAPLPGVPGKFVSTGKPIMVTRAPQKMTWAPEGWGGATATVDKGGYIARVGENDIYPIGKKEFSSLGYKLTGRRRAQPKI